MTYQEIGIDANTLQKILAGKKVVEGRLNKGKFAEIDEGTLLSLREDFYEDGKLTRSQDSGKMIQIVYAKNYPDFSTMLVQEGIDLVIPGVDTLDEGVAVYRKCYSEEDEKHYGVLALGFELFDGFEFPTN